MNALRKIVFAVALVAFLACSHKGEFSVHGTISELSGDTILVEQLNFNNLSKKDTIFAKKNGAFVFRAKNESGGPVFYHFYLAELNTLLVPVDSTENVEIRYEDGKFLFEGSESAAQIQRISAESASLRNADERKIADFKAKIQKQIYENPSSSVAFYALLLQVDGKPLFDISDKNDRKFYSMVATAYSRCYPKSVLGKWLAEQVRAEQSAWALRQNMEYLFSQKQQGLIDIALPDVNGKTCRLSEQEGKVVLLAFSLFESPFVKDEKEHLAELLDRFGVQNLVVYSVSFDVQYEQWHSLAARLPWICVHDVRALKSPLILQYNLDELPAYFLINRRGEIVSRHRALDEKLQAALQDLL